MDDSTSDIEAVMETYVKGVSANDPGEVFSAFRPDGFMWGYLGGSDPVAMPISEFLKVVGGAPAPATWVSGYRYKIRSIEVTGDVAVAVLEETGYLGADFTNYFSLVRADGQWKIAGKTFYLTAGTLPAPSAALSVEAEVSGSDQVKPLSVRENQNLYSERIDGFTGRWCSSSLVCRLRRWRSPQAR